MKKYLNISKKVRVGLAVLVGIIGLFLIFRPKPRMNDSLDEVEVNGLGRSKRDCLQVWYTGRPLRYQLWNCSAEPEPFLIY